MNDIKTPLYPEYSSTCVNHSLLSCIDTTKLKTYLSCPRKFFWEHVRGIRPTTGLAHLHFGICFHEAFEVMNRKHHLVDDSPDKLVMLGLETFANAFSDLPDDEKSFLESKGKHIDAVQSHLARYVDLNRDMFSRMKILNIEVGGTIPVLADRNKDELLNVIYRMDVIYSIDEKIFARDYKTGSRLTPDWIAQWETSLQMNLYLYALTYLHESMRVAGIIVDGFFFGKPKNFQQNEQTQEKVWKIRRNTILTYGEYVKQILDAISNRFTYRTSTCFPENPESCFHYSGCPYRTLCDIYGNNPEESLLYIPIPMNFTAYEWNPVSEVKQIKNIERNDLNGTSE